MLSKSSTYAIRALSLLAVEPRSEFRPVSEVADRLGIPSHFLKKILRSLNEQGIVKTQRSARGGVNLARPATTIPLWEIVLALDGEARFVECLLHLPGCDDANPCPMHAFWSQQRRKIRRQLQDTTLAALASDIQSHGMRISFDQL